MDMNERRSRWRAELFSDHPWQLDGQRDPDCGALSGVWFKRCAEAPFGAYMKPTTYPCEYPAAAREKIAADLAYELGILAAPVLLYDSKKRFGAVQDECCVSLVTHEDPVPWSIVWSDVVTKGPKGALVRAAAADSVSKIWAFDLWIDNRDRDNGRNVVFVEDPASPASSGFCALDHDLSLGHSSGTAGKNTWPGVTEPPFPELMRSALDRGVMLRTVQTIEQLPDETVTACVTRIPDRYMDPETRNALVTNLIRRKSELRAFVLQKDWS